MVYQTTNAMTVGPILKLPFWGKPRTGSSEDGLVEASRGDRDAFDQLVRRYETELRRFLAKRIASADVDDVVQETWLAAWTGLPQFNRRAVFKTWLYAIALNKSRDHARKQSFQSTEQTSGEIERIADKRDVFAATDLREAVQLALEELPSAQREVLELYYFAEFTLPEIAEALDRNLNTVKYQFYRAHELTAACIREANSEPPASNRQPPATPGGKVK